MSIEELEKFFKSANLPEELFLDPAVKIIDLPLFIETSINQVKLSGEKAPAYARLIKAMEILQQAK